jgi:hypothetical protein
MALRVSQAVLLVLSPVIFVTRAAADPPKSTLTDSRVEFLTSQVRGLLAEPSPPFPDPWKPRRERPKEFFVVPGEKMTYAERLTAMGLAGLANRGGPRLFIRGHFGFNADADRFWLARLAGEYGMNHREVTLGKALTEFRGSVRGAVICDERLPAAEVVAFTLAGALRGEEWDLRPEDPPGQGPRQARRLCRLLARFRARQNRQGGIPRLVARHFAVVAGPRRRLPQAMNGPLRQGVRQR